MYQWKHSMLKGLQFLLLIASSGLVQSLPTQRGYNRLANVLKLMEGSKWVPDHQATVLKLLEDSKWISDHQANEVEPLEKGADHQELNYPIMRQEEDKRSPEPSVEEFAAMNPDFCNRFIYSRSCRGATSKRGNRDEPVLNQEILKELNEDKWKMKRGNSLTGHRYSSILRKQDSKLEDNESSRIKRSGEDIFETNERKFNNGLAGLASKMFYLRV